MKKIIITLLILFIISPVFAASTATPSCGCYLWFCAAYTNAWDPICPSHSSGGVCNTACTDNSGIGGCCLGCSSSGGSGSCTCDSGWERCGSQSGCDTRVSSDPNNCGGCGISCGDAPCINGVCQDVYMWSYYYKACVTIGDDNYYGLGDGNPGFGDYYNPNSDSHTGAIGSNAAYNYRTSDGGSYNNFDCAVGGQYNEAGYALCQGTWRDCDNGGTNYNGCEIDTNTDVRKCGSCTNDCYSNPCNGADYLGYTSVTDIDSICSISCVSGSCNTYTTSGGNCDAGNDCVPDYNVPNVGVIFGLRCQADTDSEHWCCSPNQCGHDGNCYYEFEEIQTGTNFYVCKNVEGVYAWVDTPKTLSLANMLQYNRDNTLTAEDFDETIYFSNTGVSLDCGSENYNSCVYGPAHYSYQFCSKISTVFDGMFNLEIPIKVPVKVSEQSLYDPYGETTNVVSKQGCVAASGGLIGCT